MSALIFVVFGGIHAFRATNAGKINKDFPNVKGVAKPYDRCAIPMFVADPDVNSLDNIKI